MDDQVLILTTGHWEGDPRLNRHARYMRESGAEAEVVAFAGSSRATRLFGVLRAMVRMWKDRPDTVILPDPELWVTGALVARLRGITSVIDVHEDYAKAALGREWLPSWARPLVGLLAGGNDWLARRLTHVTVVAAPELADRRSVVVLNTPDPAEFPHVGPLPDPMVVYVGDVTEVRGAMGIAELARRLPEIHFLVIGRVGDELRARMVDHAGHGNVELTGLLPHGEAWTAASGAMAGLSLLEDLPAYRQAVATKLWEYCAAGIPPVVTDLPGQRSFVERLDASLVAADLDEAAAVIRTLAGDPGWVEKLASDARRLAEEEWSANRPDRRLQRAISPLPITRSDTPSPEN